MVKRSENKAIAVYLSLFLRLMLMVNYCCGGLFVTNAEGESLPFHYRLLPHDLAGNNIQTVL